MGDKINKIKIFGGDWDELGPGYGDFELVCHHIVEQVFMLCPFYRNRSRFEFKESRSFVRVTMFIEDDKNIGLIIGKRYANMAHLLYFIRFQQIYPIDRTIEVNLVKPNGDVVTFRDGSHSAYRKKHPHCYDLVKRPFAKIDRNVKDLDL